MTLSLRKLFPFLSWFPLRGATLRADFLDPLKAASSGPVSR